MKISIGVMFTLSALALMISSLKFGSGHLGLESWIAVQEITVSGTYKTTYQACGGDLKSNCGAWAEFTLITAEDR